jgi:hypothetical protein
MTLRARTQADDANHAIDGTERHSCNRLSRHDHAIGDAVADLEPHAMHRLIAAAPSLGGQS